MRWLARPIEAVATKQPIVFTTLIVMSVFAMTAETAHIAMPLRVAILLLAPLSLLLPARAGQICFAAVAALLVVALIDDYYIMANHGFVITYFAVLLALIWHDREDYWSGVQLFSRFMLATLMGVALVQKLTSLHYMSGNLMADLILTGQVYVHILPLLDPGVLDSIVGSVKSSDRLMADHAMLAAGAPVALPPLGWLLLGVIYLMTFVSVVMQGLLEYLLVFERRFHFWLHWTIFVFVLAVYSLRPENVFLSLNCVMGYALTDERSAGMRIPYVVLIAYLLISALMGFRPEMLR